MPSRTGDIVTERRRRHLDELGIARALEVRLNVAEGTVVDHLIDQAVAHIRRIRDDLSVHPEMGTLTW
ncbi:hypothetical protein FB565_003012 [Actinoplanes lutulentus]|nr:hypothetical protein [Actinoplanes lutulentus]MBB2943299.1 hypothetical protein [Actinoplanes lutulentus]